MIINYFYILNMDISVEIHFSGGKGLIRLFIAFKCFLNLALVCILLKREKFCNDFKLILLDLVLVLLNEIYWFSLF